MNKRIRNVTATAMLACVAALGTTAVLAEHPTGPICADILWNAELLKAYPRAPAMCQEIAVRDGKKFARFTAKVTSAAPDVVKVRFLTSSGSEEREMALKPGPNARVEIGGKKVEYSKLQKGDVLTFWVPERQLGVISNPDDTASSTIILK